MSDLTGNYHEDVNALSAENQRLREALEQIAGWQSHTLPFAVDFGSNGVRDFYRNIARAALAGSKESRP